MSKVNRLISPAVENRRTARKLTLLTGKVLASSDARPVDCAVFNISRSGACILVPKGTRIAESFVLRIDHDPRARACKLIWRNGSRVGLTFAQTMRAHRGLD